MMDKLERDDLCVVGRLDMLVYIEGPGAGWYHFQTKTAAANTSPAVYSAKQAMSLHEAIYGQAAIEAGFTPYKGTILNMLLKTVTGQKPRGKERKIDKDWSPFYRDKLSVGQYLRDTAIESVEWEIETMLGCEEDGYWPMRRTSCTNFNRRCTFYDLCRAPKRNAMAVEWGQREEDYVDEVRGENADINPLQIQNVSRVQTFMECPRKYLHQYVEGKVVQRDDDETPSALTFGSAVHEALRAWYSPSSLSKKTPKTWAPCLNDKRAINAFNASLPDGHDANAAECEKSGYGRLMLERYFERWREHDKRHFKQIAGVEMMLPLVIQG